MGPRHLLSDLQRRLDAGDDDAPISLQELVGMLRQWQVPASRHLVDEILAACTRDQNGQISRRDLLRHMVEAEKSLARLFERFDASQCGTISVADFKRVAGEFAPRLSPAHIDLFLQAMDKEDGDRISRQEFANYYYLLPVSTISSLFDIYDLDAADPGEPGCRRTHVGATACSTLLAGAVAGAVSRTATAPIDRLRTLMQVSRARLTIAGTLRQMLATEGLRGLYKGNGTSVLKIMPEVAVKMYSYELVKPAVSAQPELPTAFERFLAGGAAGMISQTLIYPLDLAKVQLMVSAPGEFRGLGDCLLRAYRARGFFGLYSGWAPTIVGAIPYSAVDLGTFNTLKECYLSRDGPPSDLAVMLCGALSGLCGQTVSYPFFLVRTRMQNFRDKACVYRGFVDCARQTFAHEGLLGFYKGILPSYLRGIPTVAITYVTFERAKRFFSSRVC